MLLWLALACTPPPTDDSPHAPPGLCPDLHATDPLYSQADYNLGGMFIGPGVFGVYAQAKFIGGSKLLYDATGSSLPRSPNGTVPEFGDFDADGHLDLVMTTPFGEPESSILHGPWTSDSKWLPSDFGPSFFGTYCGDLDGDGLDDRCGGQGVDQGPVDGVLDVQFNGTGVSSVDFGEGRQVVQTTWDRLHLHPLLEHAPPVALGQSPRVVSVDTLLAYDHPGLASMQVVDLDNDGDEELLVYPGGLIVDAGVFAGEAPEVWGGVEAPVGDFNGDGVHEQVVVLEGRAEIRSASGVVLLRIFQPDRGFQGFSSALVGDLDEDGSDELVLVDRSSVGGLWFFPDLPCL